MKKIILNVVICIIAMCALLMTACKSENENSNERIEALSLNVYRIQIELGKTYDLIVTTESSEQIIFLSTNNDIVEVDSNGKITAKYIGYANIIVQVEDDEKVCSVEVVEGSLSLSLNKTKEEIINGSTVSLSAELKGQLEFVEDFVEWSISNDKGSIIGNGNTALVTSASVGEVIVKASYKGLSAECKIIIRSKDAKELSAPIVKEATCKKISWYAVDGARAYEYKIGNGVWKETAETSLLFVEKVDIEGQTVQIRALSKDNYSAFDGEETTILADHDWEEKGYLNDIEPTCEVSSILIHVCNNCKEEYTEEKFAKHTYVVGKCSVCSQEGKTDGLEFYQSGDSFILYSYYGNEIEIYIPNSYEGKSVVAIDGDPFYGKGVTMFFIPETISSFNKILRGQTASLKKVIYIGNGDLAQYSFYDDNGLQVLEEVIIPNITTIKSLAFDDAIDTRMQNLTKLVVNPNVVIEDMGVRNGNADLYSTGSYSQTDITIKGSNTGLTGKIYYYTENGCSGTWSYVNGEITNGKTMHTYVDYRCTQCGEIEEHQCNFVNEECSICGKLQPHVHNNSYEKCLTCGDVKTTVGLCYYQSGSSYILYKYSGLDTEIYIPDIYNGLSISAIDFYSEGDPFINVDLKLIRFSKNISLDHIKKLIENEKQSLQTIILSLEGELTQYTFTTDCNELETVVIENVTTIKQFAFNDSVDTMMQKLTKLIVNPNVVIEDMGVRNGNADLYSTGSYEETNITIGEGNVGLTGNIYYYSENQPTDTTHTYWHYVNGVATVWAIG